MENQNDIDLEVESIEEPIKNEDTIEEAAVEILPDERDLKIAELTTDLEKARDDITKLTGFLQQLQADFDNYRKRNASSTIEAKQKGVFEAVKTLLPAFDSVSMAKKQIADEQTLSGLEMVERQLISSLAELEITPILAEGTCFDPNLHNAVVAEDVEGVESGVILEEYTRGYTSPNGVVRFSVVKIAK